MEGVKNQALEGLADLLAKQKDVMATIAREKDELRPFLDQWEQLKSEDREKFRNGKAGEILMALESVAKSIHARHQQMFGGEDLVPPAGSQGGEGGKEDAAKPPDLSQTINIYRALQ